VPEPVVGHRVVTGVLAEREEHRCSQDDPAERVARLAPGHHETRRGEGSRDPDRHGTASGVQALMRQAGKRRIGDHQRQHQGAQHQRRRRRCQAETAARQISRLPRLRPGQLRLHHRMPRYARTVPERYRPNGSRTPSTGQTNRHAGMGCAERV